MRSGFAVVLGLAACSPQAQDRIARDAARATVGKAVVQRYPGVPVQPAIDCLIDNAGARQIYALAGDGVTGPTESTFRIVADIAAKPQTLTCLATNGLPALVS